MNCLNCDAPLTGAFCASCGQRHVSRPPTVARLIEDTLETLTHADSRLWVTLRYLMTKPGVLTRDYFAGRRNSYLPPIRLYLIISVVFFLLASLPNTDKSAEKPIEIDSDSQICEVDYTGPFAEFVGPRFRAACKQLKADNGAKLVESFQRNVPKAMFILLPAFAALMMLFFWRPRRLYVEHLLFLVHNHSAVFAALILDTISGFFLPASVGGFFSTALVLYLAWYCWHALRVFYEKRTGKAWALFIGLGFLYSVLATITLILTGFASFLAS
ncbi:MAG: DUF3667 domain-containing protein [Acidibacter sp.]|nr:DUF3667 domain-containing protein [Acidibacter sp.]